MAVSDAALLLALSTLLTAAIAGALAWRPVQASPMAVLRSR